MRAIANESLNAADASKQERKLTRAEGARSPSAPTSDLSLLFYAAREKVEPDHCNEQETSLIK